MYSPPSVDPSPRLSHPHYPSHYMKDLQFPFRCELPLKIQRSTAGTHSFFVPRNGITPNGEAPRHAHQDVSQSHHLQTPVAVSNLPVNPIRLPPCIELLASVDKVEEMVAKGTFKYTAASTIDPGKRKPGTTKNMKAVKQIEEQSQKVPQLVSSDTVRAAKKMGRVLNRRTERRNKNAVNLDSRVKKGGIMRTKGKHICQHCGYGPRQKSDIQRHVDAIHHGLRPYKCSACPCRFPQLSHAKNHELHVHGSAPREKCSLCSKTYTVRSSVTRHMRKKH